VPPSENTNTLPKIKVNSPKGAGTKTFPCNTLVYKKFEEGTRSRIDAKNHRRKPISMRVRRPEQSSE
jgi:hypothetical protein